VFNIKVNKPENNIAVHRNHIQGHFKCRLHCVYNAWVSLSTRHHANGSL